jgi:hypothetical protein
MVDARAHFGLLSARGELYSRRGGRFTFAIGHGRFNFTLILRDVPGLRATLTSTSPTSTSSSASTKFVLGRHIRRYGFLPDRESGFHRTGADGLE